jgi:hypothetical protein
MIKKQKLQEEPPEDYNEFIVWFMEKHKRRIYKCAYKRTIHNRYAVQDIYSYISETILSILKRRASVNRPIKEPNLYFSKLVDFYCVEYQRMNGFIYSLPKRPRDNSAEEDISQYGFHYMEANLDLGYIDYDINGDSSYLSETYQVKGDYSDKSAVWNTLLDYADSSDADVINCVYNMNLSIQEASKHLKISPSTAYQRLKRGLYAISGMISNTGGPSWKVFQGL